MTWSLDSIFASPLPWLVASVLLALGIGAALMVMPDAWVNRLKRRSRSKQKLISVIGRQSRGVTKFHKTSRPNSAKFRP